MKIILLTIILLLISLNVNASPDKYKVHHDHHPDPVNGVDGKDGQSIKGDRGATGLNGRDAPYVLNNLNLSRSIAVSASLGQIPALSHVGTHNHTGIGFGGANYNGENAVAVGLLHQEKQQSYKVTIGVSGSERIVGAGASFAFK